MKTSLAPTSDWCKWRKMPSFEVKFAALEVVLFSAKTMRAVMSPYSTREQVDTMVETTKGDLPFQPSGSGITVTLY